MNDILRRPGIRRGRRIRRSLPLVLHWREPQGKWREVPAQTKILSKYGCLLSCSERIKLSDEVVVWWMEGMRYADAHVVFRKLSAGESAEIAVEFLDVDEFWGIDFSPAVVAAEIA